MSVLLIITTITTLCTIVQAVASFLSIQRSFISSGKKKLNKVLLLLTAGMMVLSIILAYFSISTNANNSSPWPGSTQQNNSSQGPGTATNSTPVASSTPSLTSTGPTPTNVPTLIPTPTPVPPSGTYNANFSDPSGWEWPRNGNYSEWEPSNGTLIYSNSGNTTSSRALSPADIRTPNYAIEAQVQVIFSDWGGCSQAGVFSRGMGFYDYSGGVVKFCGDTGEYFVISACQSECNNIAYSRADIEGVKITFRLEVRGTDLAFYIDGGKLFEGKANTSNKATRTGIFAHGIKSMQVYSFKVGAL